MTRYDIAKSHTEWLDLRSKGLGGSDIGTVLGLNSWKSPYQLWLEKTNQIEVPDISDKIAVQIGHELEDLVARIFTQETGLKVQRDNKTYYHKDYPFLLANIDRKIIGQQAFLECKTTSAFNADQWQDGEIPQSYFMQVQHYLNVLDYDYAYIAVLIGNHDFVYQKIERDEELIELYQAQAVEFWQGNVLGGLEPPIDGTLVTREALNLRYSDLSDKEMVMDSHLTEKVQYIQDLKEESKRLKVLQNQEENAIKSYMGDHDVQRISSEDYIVTWKKQSRTSVDSQRLRKERPDIFEAYSKTSTFKRFTIKER